MFKQILGRGEISMVVHTGNIPFKTQGEIEIIDITQKVQKIVHDSKIENGIATVFVPGATGAITTIEYEDGLVEDLTSAFERLYSRDLEYKHELRWHDGNGHSHIRASMVGPSITVPFTSRQLVLGTWQQIIFVELDVRPHDRNIVVQIIGE
jgi:secondary thiamine-phosphate synthase enzyme